jgi:hypothetical protein
MRWLLVKAYIVQVDSLRAFVSSQDGQVSASVGGQFAAGTTLQRSDTCASGCKRLPPALMSRLVQGPDYLSLGVLHPVWGTALRGDRWGFSPLLRGRYALRDPLMPGRLVQSGIKVNGREIGCA